MKKTLLAIIIMAFALVTSAQDNAIIFTDFEPDSIRVLGEENCMDTIFIDIDNDGTMDLALVSMNMFFRLAIHLYTQ